jgi:uroporphyrinogen-III synthase
LRIALARPGAHPISRAIQEAGWEPVDFPLTRIVSNGAPPPQPLNSYRGVVLLSPGSAWALRPWLEPGTSTVLLAQGQGTLEALGETRLETRLAATPTAEGIWELLQRDFPDGGSFLLARAERSRGYLEEVSSGTLWKLWPWITHHEQPMDPLPKLPPVDAVLALSPMQAELLGPMSQHLLRFGWGERTVFGFRKAGMEPTATCEPRLEALTSLLREHLHSKA